LDESIGFTDFEEGSKSEIFRRCDAGASNENPDVGSFSGEFPAFYANPINSIII